MFMKKIPGGALVEAYPLTLPQQFMYFVSLGFGGTIALNICSGYYWEGEMDKPAMREAIREAIERCETMRLRFCEDRKFGTVQYIVKDSGIEIGYENYRDCTQEEAYDTIKKWSREPIDMFNKPLHTVKIMDMPNNRTGIYLKAHHLAMDGYSVKVFLADVMGIYVSKVSGSPYPKPMKSYRDILARDAAYRESPQHEEDKAFWYNNFFNRPEPIFTDFLRENRLFRQRKERGEPERRRAILNGGDVESRARYYEMDAAFSADLLRFCDEQNLSISCVLMMALRTALSVFNRNEEDVSFKLMVNRRGTLTEKKCGGDCFMFFPFRSIVSPENTILEAIRLLETAQNDIFRHASFSGIDVLNLLHAATHSASLDETYDSMAFSYHPYVDTPVTGAHMRETSCGVWYHNDISLANLYLTVKHRTNDKGFQFIFEYKLSANPLEDIDIFYGKMVQTLQEALADPTRTVGELLQKLAIE